MPADLYLLQASWSPRGRESLQVPCYEIDLPWEAYLAARHSVTLSSRKATVAVSHCALSGGITLCLWTLNESKHWGEVLLFRGRTAFPLCDGTVFQVTSVPYCGTQTWCGHWTSWSVMQAATNDQAGFLLSHKEEAGVVLWRAETSFWRKQNLLLPSVSPSLGFSQ